MRAKRVNRASRDGWWILIVLMFFFYFEECEIMKEISMSRTTQVYICDYEAGSLKREKWCHCERKEKFMLQINVSNDCFSKCMTKFYWNYGIEWTKTSAFLSLSLSSFLVSFDIFAYMVFGLVFKCSYQKPSNVYIILNIPFHFISIY